jgi:uncharacterized protein YxjI
MFKITSNSIETDILEREIGNLGANFTITSKDGVTTIIVDDVNLQLNNTIDLDTNDSNGESLHIKGKSSLGLCKWKINDNILNLEQKLTDLFVLYADQIKKLK